MHFKGFGSTKPDGFGFPPPPSNGFGGFGGGHPGFGAKPFCVKPAVPVELHEGVFIELRKSDDNEDLCFKIDCDIEHLASGKVEERLSALTHLEAWFGQFATIPDTAAATDTTIACRLRTPLFRCNTVLIRMEVLDMLMNIISDDSTPTTTIENNDDIEQKRLVLLCKEKAIKLIDSVTSADAVCSVEWANTKPKLQEVLFAAALHPETSTTHSTLLHLTAHDSSSHRQSILRTISSFKSDPPCDTVLIKAVDLFTPDEIEVDQRVEFLDMLADSLQYVMAEGTSCSLSRVITLATLLQKVQHVWLSGHVPLMDALLQVVCFHSDASIRNTCLNHLVALGELSTLRCLQDETKNTAALDWWSQRCLPTWVDLLVKWTKLDESEFVNDAAGFTFMQVSNRIQELLTTQLPAEGLPDMPRFTVELVDGGGYEKLKATLDSLPSDASRYALVRKLCDHVDGGENPFGFLNTNKLKDLQFIQWSWGRHEFFPADTRKAVCAIFSAALYTHPRTGEVSELPSEVAYEICSYLPIRRCIVPKALHRPVVLVKDPFKGEDPFAKKLKKTTGGFEKCDASLTVKFMNFGDTWPSREAPQPKLHQVPPSPPPSEPTPVKHDDDASSAHQEKTSPQEEAPFHFDVQRGNGWFNTIPPTVTSASPKKSTFKFGGSFATSGFQGASSSEPPTTAGWDAKPKAKKPTTMAALRKAVNGKN